MNQGETPQLQSTTAYLSSQYSPPTNESFMSETGTANMMADVMPAFQSAVMGGTGFNPVRGMMKGIPIMAALRKVQQFLTDPDPNIPLERRVLYEGPIFLTDETDNELVYRVAVQELLLAHNEFRVTVRDKTFRDKEVFLEPARIRDLRLTTVTIANI